MCVCACDSERVRVQLFVLGCRADTHDIGELYEYVTWYEGARG